MVKETHTAEPTVVNGDIMVIIIMIDDDDDDDYYKLMCTLS